MKAAVAGATGFVGSFLVDLLTNDDAFEHATILSRKELALSEKFDVRSGDFSEAELTDIDVAFCALGTTMATAGSKQAFYHVDHDLVLAFAKNAANAGAKCFVLVSSVGADPNSSNFYLKVKGETERDLASAGFRSLIILRPSMLMGNRKEFRLGELIGKGAMRLVNPLMLGLLAKYRGIDGLAVAKAMVRLSKEDLPGIHTLEGNDLHAFS